MNIDPKELKDYVEDLLQQRKSRYEPEWYRNLHSYENNHFVGWNRVTGTIQVVPTKKRFFLQLPETKRQADAFENLLLRQNPLYQIYPTDYSDKKQIEDARFQSLFLRQRYIDYHESNIIHDLVHNATVMPISFIEIAKVQRFDTDTQTMVDTTAPRVYDAFDIVFDPRYLFEDNEIIVKIIRTTPRRIKQSKIYKGFEGDITSGSGDYKEMFFSDKFGRNTPAKEFERVILYECHIKEKRDGIPGIRIVTIDAQGSKLRDDYIKGMPFFSIIPFQPYSGNPYQPSFVQGLNPLNRSLDIIANRIESMMMKHVKGQYLMPDNSDVTMTDEDGTVIKYRGMPPTPLPIPPLPAAAWQWMNLLISFCERYGVNQLALGGTPSGSQFRAASMMQKALDGAVQQQKTPLENLMYTMRRMAETILFMESNLITEPRAVTVKEDTPNGSGITKKVVGEEYYDLYREKGDVVPLPKMVKKMEIQIEDREAQSIVAKRASMIELIDTFAKTPPGPLQEIILDLYRVGNTSDVMTKMALKQTILDSPEMKAIIEQNRQGMFNDQPQLKQAIGIFLNFLAQQSPVPSPDAMGVQSAPPKPASAPPA